LKSRKSINAESVRKLVRKSSPTPSALEAISPLVPRVVESSNPRLELVNAFGVQTRALLTI
jgi:hypothetical protein